MSIEPGPPARAPIRSRILSVALWAAAALAVGLLIAFVDRPAMRWILVHRDGQPWRSLSGFLWPLGSGTLQTGLILASTILAYLLRKRRAQSICRALVATLLIATILTTGVKWIVRRPRPEHMDEPRPVMRVQLDSGEWHSFPSGDALVTTSLVVALWIMLGRTGPATWLLVIPPLVCLQRLSAGRHYPSDVLTGLIIGAWLAGAILRHIPPFRQQPALIAAPRPTVDSQTDRSDTA